MLGLGGRMKKKRTRKSSVTPKLTEANVQDIVLVGGSAHIPRIIMFISDFFNNKELNKSIDSDKAVVSKPPEGSWHPSSNTTPPFSPKNPRIFTGYTDNQPAFMTQVFKGKHACTGKFGLSDIPPASHDVQIEGAFGMDANGILNMSAADKTTSKSNHITIANNKGLLMKEEIERMVEEAE
ncbi:HSP70-domain-containing protein [Dendrothele bispora CBS 962.96]|uniref:HSP70-domain-containing protein n=1 Tax=Dendrothele bispora (strain CBS 962.96) TaxID=1314807 RepID=A0A4S8L7N7_DENBC|nr:HSP70-domain-containing protein [Dendrothele bispora CBS 962.96]